MTARSPEDYLLLVTSEHQQKPNFSETIKASVTPMSQIQAVLASLSEKFDVDVATGVQLDAVGQWAGITRYIDTPLTDVYFTWDGANRTGWDAGVWQGPFDPDSGLTTLPDDSYRLLVKAKIAANSWDGTIPGAYNIWTTVFKNSYIIIQDNQDMSMIVGMAGEQLDTVSQALLTGGYIPIKPEGVRVDYYAISVNDGPLFAWDSNVPALAGWDTGSWALELPPT